MVQELDYGYIMDITSKLDIAKVILGCVARRQLIKPRTEARRASRYQVHGRRKLAKSRVIELRTATAHQGSLHKDVTYNQ